ncbi:EF hand, partial [Opisthorchis viverrini]
MTRKFLDKASLEKRFRELDSDGSGWLSKEEYTKEVERMGYPASLAQASFLITLNSGARWTWGDQTCQTLVFMRVFDKDNDGQVTMTEFITSLMNVQ